MRILDVFTPAIRTKPIANARLTSKSLLWQPISSRLYYIYVKNVNTQNLKISDLWLVICNSNGNLYSCIACF